MLQHSFIVLRLHLFEIVPDCGRCLEDQVFDSDFLFLGRLRCCLLCFAYFVRLGGRFGSSAFGRGFGSSSSVRIRCLSRTMLGFVCLVRCCKCYNAVGLLGKFIVGDFLFDLVTLPRRSLGTVSMPRRLEPYAARPAHTAELAQSLSWPPLNYLPQGMSSVRAINSSKNVCNPVNLASLHGVGWTHGQTDAAWAGEWASGRRASGRVGGRAIGRAGGVSGRAGGRAGGRTGARARRGPGPGAPVPGPRVFFFCFFLVFFCFFSVFFRFSFGFVLVFFWSKM